MIATYFTAPTDDETLRSFYRLIKPGGSGWDKVIDKANSEGDVMKKEIGQLPLEILCVIIGCITVYAALFAVGNWIYWNIFGAFISTFITLLGAIFFMRVWSKLKVM